MVAYNFMHRWAPDVEEGRKPFTIRDDRKPPSRHARPGEEVQLYVDQRLPTCRKLVEPDPICERVVPIIIWKVTEHRCAIVLNEKMLDRDKVDYVVVTDGFESHEAFMKYHLGDLSVVKKVFIQWGFWNAE